MRRIVLVVGQMRTGKSVVAQRLEHIGLFWNVFNVQKIVRDYPVDTPIEFEKMMSDALYRRSLVYKEHDLVIDNIGVPDFMHALSEAGLFRNEFAKEIEVWEVNRETGVPDRWLDASNAYYKAFFPDRVRTVQNSVGMTVEDLYAQVDALERTSL